MNQHVCEECNTPFECNDTQHMSCYDYFQWADKRFNCPKCMPAFISFPKKKGEQSHIHRYTGDPYNDDLLNITVQTAQLLSEFITKP